MVPVKEMERHRQGAAGTLFRVRAEALLIDPEDGLRATGIQVVWGLECGTGYSLWEAAWQAIVNIYVTYCIKELDNTPLNMYITLALDLFR